MVLAFNAVRNGMKLSTAVKKFGLRRTTLRDRLTGRTSLMATVQKRGEAKKIFSEEEEIKLIEYIKKMAVAGYGLNHYEFRKLALDFAVQLRLKTSSENKEMRLSECWLERFCNRHKDENLKVIKMYIFNFQSAHRLKISFSLCIF